MSLTSKGKTHLRSNTLTMITKQTSRLSLRPVSFCPPVPVVLLLTLLSLPAPVAAQNQSTPAGKTAAFSPNAAAAAADRAALTSGVRELIAPGALPGAIAVWGPKAFVVLSAGQNKERIPLLGAASWGKGNVVAAGHGGFWDARALQNGDNARFFTGIVHYLSHNQTAPRLLLVSADDSPVKAAISGAVSFATVETVSPDTLGRERLAQTDVLIMGQDALVGKNADKLITLVRDWIKRGGGLLIAGPAWGWKQLHPERDLLTDHTGNRLLRPLGLAFADGSAGGRGRQGGYPVEAEESPLLHGQAALDALTLGQNATPADLAQAAQTLALIVGAVPSDEAFAARVASLCQNAASIVPSKETPVTNAAPLVRLKMTLDARAMKKLPPEKITANPASVSFPGPLPTNAPRLAGQEVAVDTAIPDWHGTGLYAPPGEVITVVLPPGVENKNLAVRIGAHKDELWNLPKWERFPEITTEQKIKGSTLRLASPFGGPIYLVVPANCKLGVISVSISGAVAAPRYVRNKTTLADWQRVRANPAPWAELEGDKCILTVPSDVVRNLTNPDALMAYWDGVMDACADLYARPRTRTRPERYCTDRQISAGYMHSGYPIMTGLDVAPRFTDLTVLTGKNGGLVWGFYHELGHNHQQADWTWDGTGEVTNNLFSLYGSEVLNGATPPAHPALAKEAAEKKLQTYLANGATYEQWKSDPFLALGLFSKLRDAFGWEPFTKVFAQYRTLGASQHPKTDEEKRDQFMVRFSQIVGKNLGSYFTTWGVPTSDTARAQIANLPSWMPDGFPPVVADKNKDTK